MADLRESFAILEDDSTGAGEALISRIEGEASAAKEGLIAFSFKDDSGNVILPALNASGQLPVITTASISCVTGTAKVSGSASEVTVLDVSVTVAKDITEIEVLASCFRDTIWRLVHVDDPAGTPTETELGLFVSGSGQFSIDFAHKCMKVAGAASVTAPVLRLLGTNENKLSDMRGTISAAIEV